MKKMITLLMLLVCSITFAQDKIYVHESTASNTSFNGTVINHPDLNNNPNANIVFSHRFGGAFNNNVNGLWYRNSDGRWIIYNEDNTVDMQAGLQFTIFIADQAVVFNHVASTANQGTSNSNTLLDHPLLNGEDPGPIAIFSNYFNPNNVFNNNTHGFTFDTTLFNNRLIYNESFTPIPNNDAFKVMVIPPGGIPDVTTFGHFTSTGNTDTAITTLDNASLNDNPDAAFVFSHYYGAFGAPSNNNINKPVGAVYEPLIGRWQLYTEDLSPMPLGVAFDIVIAEREILAVGDNEILVANVTMYPNPSKGLTTITSTEEINSISIFNILGQEIFQSNYNSNTISIDISNYATGNYFIKVQTGESINTLKLIKN